MALVGRPTQHNANSFIWPGFVDALATLIMVLIFVLMVFFLIQTNLLQRVVGQDSALDNLRNEISILADTLNLEQQKNIQLNIELKNAQNNLARVTQQFSDLEAKLNQANQEKNSLQEELQATRDENKEALQKADSEVKAARAEILTLIQATEELKEKIGQLQALLEEKEEEARVAKEASVNLSKQLNDALSSKVLELQKFRSEFFGILREILKDQPDIKIVGDRFVFQSEVLFGPASATIGIEGEKQLNRLSQAILEISERIPTDIDWVLQINGHTDNVPINTPLFKDNWDLSVERALSVLRYLTLAGVDQNRLVAAGFGEFQPIAPNDTPENKARNRRIEVKITRK